MSPWSSSHHPTFPFPFTLLAVWVLMALVPETHEWWDNGHMLVAEIAVQQLGNSQRHALERILHAWDPAFPGLGELTSASVWADHIKCTNDSSTATTPTPTSTLSKYCGALPSVPALDLFNAWHFYSTAYNPLGMPLTPAQASPPDNPSAVYVLEKAHSLLPRSNDAFAWNFLLRFVLHVLGDLHQPLHCAQLFTPTFFPDGDQGGTLIYLNDSSRRRSSAKTSVRPTLHGVWDSVGALYPASWPLSEAQRRQLRQNASALTRAYPRELFISTHLLPSDADARSPEVLMKPRQWIQEGYELSREFVYVGWDLSESASPGVLSPAYVRRLQELCQRQLALAGYRLALWLAYVATFAPQVQAQAQAQAQAQVQVSLPFSNPSEQVVEEEGRKILYSSPRFGIASWILLVVFGGLLLAAPWVVLVVLYFRLALARNGDQGQGKEQKGTSPLLLLCYETL